MTIQTEFEFTLPRGYLDPAGVLHRQGRMRLATAFDEMEAINDQRVQANAAYLPALLLSRVVTHLGDLTLVTPQVVTSLFASDLAFLEDLYQRLNSPEAFVVETRCPYCHTSFHLHMAPLAEQPS